MKTVESALVVCVVGLACFIGGQEIGVRRATARQVSTGAIVEHPSAEVAPAVEEAFGTAMPEVRVRDGGRSGLPSMSALDRRRRLAQGASDTYIGDLITARDSAIVHWPDRLTRPLRVWIGEDATLGGWNPDLLPAVRDAFDTWVQTGIPVHFTFVVDSATADVHVRFTERFANGISGKTVWSRDNAWWLVSGDIQLALAHPSGGTVNAPQIRAIALHEVGHLLGLDHSSAPDHIMSARIRVRELTEVDRATVRLLYSVPAGTLR